MKKHAILLVVLAVFVGQGGAQSSEIDFKVFGEGPEVLIIPGTRALEVPLYEMLAQELALLGVKVVLYNPVGTEEDFQMETFDVITLTDRIEEIEIIRKELGIRSWSVIGTGLGNLIACYYATDYPMQVGKMIFVSPTFHHKENLPLHAKSYKEDALNNAKRVKNNYPEYSKEEVFMFGVDVLAKQLVDNEEHKDVVKESLIRIFPYEHIPELLDEMLATPPDFEFVARNFSNRIFIVIGENDKETLSFQRERDRFLKHFSTEKVYSVKHSGRFVWLEQKETFYEGVNDFLNKQ